MATQSTLPSGARGGMTSTLLWGLLVVGLIAFGWSYYNYYQTSHKLAVLTDPKLASQLNEKQTAALLAKISQLIVLPKDKNPIVATIKNVETLAGKESFYTYAHNGDKLVIFQASRKAVLYDETNNRIVNSGPIFFNSADAEKKATAQSDRLAIEIRNGSTNSSAGVTLRDKLEANYSYNVVRLGKAAKNTYDSTILVDNTDGTKADLVAALQKELGATVAKEAPQGEAAPKNEILIIVGAR